TGGDVDGCGLLRIEHSGMKDGLKSAGGGIELLQVRVYREAHSFPGAHGVRREWMNVEEGTGRRGNAIDTIRAVGVGEGADGRPGGRDGDHGSHRDRLAVIAEHDTAGDGAKACGPAGLSIKNGKPGKVVRVQRPSAGCVADDRLGHSASGPGVLQSQGMTD